MEVNETKSIVYPRFSPPVPIFFLGSEFIPGGLADGKVVVGGGGGIRRLPNSPHPNIPSRREAIFLSSVHSHFTHEFFYRPGFLFEKEVLKRYHRIQDQGLAEGS